MLPYKRSQRVGYLIKEEIAEIIMYKLKDPRIGFVTVTGADLSPDLKSARIFVSILKEEERDGTLEALNSSRTFMRSILAKRLRMKYIPHLEFKLDASIDYGFKIDKILRDIKEKDEDA